MTTGIRNAAEYQIVALGDCRADDHWVAVRHEPCEEFIFGDGEDDADGLDAAALLLLIAAHRCSATEAGAR